MAAADQDAETIREPRPVSPSASTTIPRSSTAAGRARRSRRPATWPLLHHRPPRCRWDGEVLQVCEEDERLEVGRIRLNEEFEMNEADREEALLRAAIDSYNSLEKTEFVADLDSDPRFLERIQVNYLRHERTFYDEAMSMAEDGEAKHALREHVLERIARAYPHLASECDRQMQCDRQMGAPPAPDGTCSLCDGTRQWCGECQDEMKQEKCICPDGPFPCPMCQETPD